VGEIAIRSRYLARGYWGRPELTAGAFRPCPDDPQARIYRSGDLGRLDDEGCLTYLGRQDFRVKVRGRWVDLETIQEVITSRSEVDSAVVLSRGDGEQEPAIVAYVVADHGAALDDETLRQALAAEIPGHMMPGCFVFIDALPLDSNGKIARKELPPPDGAQGQSKGVASPPRGELETVLAGCWCKALRREEIGRHDDFFDLGGDSLQALELVLAIERSLERPLSLSAIVETATIASLAEALRDNRALPVAVPLAWQGTKRPFFCVHGHDGHVLQLRALARHLGNDRPVYGLRVPTDRNHQPLVTTVEEMASFYLGEVRAIQPQGPYFLGGYCFGGLVALEMAHRLVKEGEEIGCLALIGTQAPGAPPLPTPALWLRRHWKALVDLPRDRRPAYLARRFLNILPVLVRHLRLRIHRHIWQACERRGRRPPARLLTPEYVCEIAGGKYRPAVFDRGRSVVFACKPEALAPADPYSGWRDRITKGLAIHHLGATTSLVMREPGVGELARELQRILDEVGGR
jgi:thioesterase domain-containing protein/acyl carrier protein